MEFIWPRVFTFVAKSCPDGREVSGQAIVRRAALIADRLKSRGITPGDRGADVVLMETEHFVRRPTAWLETISRYRGTTSTAPPTALKLPTRRKAQDIDLSSWR